jgi:hypothetical protein
MKVMKNEEGVKEVTPHRLLPRQRLTVAMLGLYLALQLLIPLRHWLYPGNVNWTEEGHRFSWHMKLRTKKGEAVFFVSNPAAGATWEINPRKYLKPRQATNMAVHPDMILQFAHYLADEFRKQGHEPVEVRAHVLVSLNGRKPQLLIDPTVDLATQPRTWRHVSWIIPLHEPLRIGEPTKSSARKTPAENGTHTRTHSAVSLVPCSL